MRKWFIAAGIVALIAFEVSSHVLKLHQFGAIGFCVSQVRQLFGQ